MEVKIIRGYKLKLWKDRLNLAPEFIRDLDLKSKNFVHAEYPRENEVIIILFTKMHGAIIPVELHLTAEQLESISERVTI